MTRRAWWGLALVIAALALAASANSIANAFAYDDVYLIAKSARMHSFTGWWREFAHTYWPEASGGDGYRPLTIIAFRAEWAVGGGNPAVFHSVNVALHVMASVAVFWMACAVLPLGAAWIAGAIYAVHPVHVEAIANVVGQSELAVVLLITLTVGVYLHGRQAGALTWRRWVSIGALYAGALLFKEHAIVLPALLILAEFTVVRDTVSWRARANALRVPVLSLTVVALVYLWARSRVVVGGLSGFEPYVVFQALRLSRSDRILTMIGASPEWLRLFVWPARLMTEYAPPYIDVAQGPGISQLPGLLVLIGVLGLAVAAWRRSPATTFGIFWIVVTLLPASNFIVPAGFIIAERTLLLPSVGAVLALATVVPWLFARIEERPPLQYAAAAVFVLLLGLGITRSVTRNRAWRDTETLFREAIKDSPESYRAHFMLGVHLFEQKKKIEAEAQYRQAFRLFPYDPNMAYALAEQYRGAQRCEPAIILYRWMFTIEPTANRGHIGLATCLLLTLQLDSARVEALRAIQTGARLKDARAIIQTAIRAKANMAQIRASRDSANAVHDSANAAHSSP